MRFDIRRLETCPSTNDAVRELAAAGAPEGAVVVAGEQTAGRGTKGRAWHSPPGLGLYASILLRPAFSGLSLLPIAAGLAVRDAVASAEGIAVRLRWPNDIVLDGRKLGGILCESGFLGDRPEYAVLGIGLNVNHGPADFPDALRDGAVSLRIALGRPADRERLLGALLAAVDHWTGALARGEAALIVRDFDSSSFYRPGEPVLVSAADDPSPARDSQWRASPAAGPASAAGRRFVYEGIDADGALLIRGPDGLRRFLSGEVRKVL